MTRARTFTAAGLVQLIVALLLSISFLTAQPASECRAALGFTPTFTPLPPTPAPTEDPTQSPQPPGEPAVELRLSKTSDPGQALPGGTVIFTVVVENVGKKGATGVTIVDDVPSQLTVLEATVSQGEVSIDDNRVKALVGVLGPGYSATLTIQAQVRSDLPLGTQIENVASGWCDQTGAASAGAALSVGSGLLPEAGSQRVAGLAAAALLFVLGNLMMILGIHLRRSAQRKLPAGEQDTGGPLDPSLDS